MHAHTHTLVATTHSSPIATEWDVGLAVGTGKHTGGAQRNITHHHTWVHVHSHTQHRQARTHTHQTVDHINENRNMQ